jgi:uncharacterized Zn finger protein
MPYWKYAPYVPVSERRAKADKKVKQLRKKNPNIKPVIIDGRALAQTWWGKSWNQNLERYADYSNRIGRGRSYVRHGSVLDLQIVPGRIEALVQGSRSKPYRVDIRIKEMNKLNWLKIKNACEGSLESLQELLAGKFPKLLADTFMAQGKGLFPTPDEIEFECSCPDWAYMCKHVAAVLYGIGARLDENPALFFELRKLEIGDLVNRAVEDKTRKLLDRARRKSARVMEETDLEDVFGIVMEKDVDFKKAKKTARKKATPQKVAPPPKRQGNARTRGPGAPDIDQINLEKEQALQELKAARKELRLIQANTQKKPRKAIDQIEGIIMKCRKGIGITELNHITGIEKNKLYSLIHRLKKQERIRNRSYGIYEKNS